MDAEPYEHAAGPHKSGIYFLINGASIVYVGLSKYIRTRLVQHSDSGIQFTPSWCFGGIPDIFLEDVEIFYIHALQPPLNVKYPPLVEPASIYLDSYLAGTLEFLHPRPRDVRSAIKPPSDIRSMAVNWISFVRCF